MAAAAQNFVFINFAEPEYLDPGQASDSVSSEIIVNLFEGLLDFDPKDLHPIPGAAERYDVSPDGKVYTFYLRKNAKWSDGTALTAHDFVYSWQRVANPITAAKYAYMLYYVKNAEAINKGKIKDVKQLGAKAIDDHTLRVELENPTAFFPSIAAWYTLRPVKKEVVEKHDRRWTLPENIVTNGYFRLVEWIPNKQIVLEPNPHYWDRQNIKLAQVKFLPIEDRETALKMFLTGQAHYLNEVPDIKVPQLRSHPEYVDGPMLGTYFLWVHVNRPALKDKRVRQALAHAIDRAQLVKVINRGIPHASLTPTGINNYIPPPGPEFNPERARQLLAEAGFADPKKFPPLTITYNTSDNHKMIMEIVQSMWKQHLGIDVKLQNMEWKSYLKSLQTYDYDIGRMGWIGDYMDPNTFLDLSMTGGGNNHSGWANPRYDGLVKSAWQTTDNQQRNAFFQEAEKILLDELPLIPIFVYTRPTMQSQKLVGFYHNLQDLHPLKGAWMKE